MSAEGCRIDVWLWRARFVKTRALAVALVERGALRLTHQGRQVRVDKPGRTIHPGDELVFSLNERITAVRVEALGQRRGPPAEARALYSQLDVQSPPARGLEDQER